MKTDRRKFINILLGGGLTGLIASILYPVFSFLKPPPTKEATVSSVKDGVASKFPKNSGKIIKFGRKPVILIKTEEGDLRAFSAVCTHLGCIVQYNKDTHMIWCACHNGMYDLNGRNVSGPPPKPLQPYNVKVSDDNIFITEQQS